MKGHGSKLGHKQEAAIAALLSEPTISAAAAKVPVAERTLKEWLTDPAFQRAYREARQSILDRVVVRLLDACGVAVAKLRANLDEGRPGEQTRAAVAILTQATRGVELLDLAERLTALEERQQQWEARQP